MLECCDISVDKYRGLRLHFNDDESADEVLTINMTEGAAIGMARWIMQNWGHKRYMTLEEAKEIILKEGAEAI